MTASRSLRAGCLIESTVGIPGTPSKLAPRSVPRFAKPLPTLAAAARHDDVGRVPQHAGPARPRRRDRGRRRVGGRRRRADAAGAEECEQMPRVLEDAGRGDGGVLQQGGRAGAQDHVQGVPRRQGAARRRRGGSAGDRKEAAGKEAARGGAADARGAGRGEGDRDGVQGVPEGVVQGARPRGRRSAQAAQQVRAPHAPSGGRAHPGGREHPATH